MAEKKADVKAEPKKTPQKRNGNLKLDCTFEDVFKVIKKDSERRKR